ncbi:MAG: glycosyl hydrolase family 28-related protein, partial [Verrucomicrobiota bacterium]
MIYTCFLFGLSAGLLDAQVVPANRHFICAWNTAGYPGEIAVPDRIVKVSDHGAVGNGVSNDAPAVSAAIASLGGSNGVVFFSAGTYLIQSPINLPEGTVLRGQRSENTTLRFDFVQDCINISRGQGAAFQPVVSGYALHATNLVVTDGSAFQPGDYVEIREDNDPGWDASTWAPKVVGQIMRVAAV